MTDGKEIDLLIRAQLKGKQDLVGITKSIQELEKAIESQAEAAKKGEGSIDELKASLLALQGVQERLKGQADLVATYQRLGDAIQRADERVARASKQYDVYKQKLDKANEVTEKQQDRLVRLSVAAERAQEALGKQNARYASLADTLREAGIATDQLAGAEDKLRANAAQVGISIAKAQSSIEGYAVNVRKARDAEKSLAEENAFQKKLADAEKLNRAAGYVDFWSRSLDNLDQAEKRVADEAVFQKKLTDAAKLNRAAEYVNFWSNALEVAEKAEHDLAQNKALSKVADQAQEAAKGYTTLARAATNLAPKTTSLKDAIASITSPAEEARKTVSGIETEVESLASAIGKINGPVREYQATLRQLATANKAISSQASLIDDFNRQTVALRAAREEFTQARAKVTEYAAAVRQGGADGQKFTAALGEAQRRAGAAAQALQQQLSATRASRDVLRAAGIATNDLTAAQTRLVVAATKGVAATKALTAAHQQYGDSVSKTKSSFDAFKDGGRTTLSLMQRIRGEVLALAASYVGLQGTISLAGSSVEAFSKREGIQNQLGLSVGNDRSRIDAEYAYVKSQSDRIGIEFDTASKGYAKFAAAAAIAGRDSKEIRFIWESFAEIGRVANLTSDDLLGVFKALEQVTSKGKIQAEELRGQLGDRLFGAFEIAAKALKDQFPDLDKAMENGLVTANQLVKVAEEYRRTVADQLPAAQKSLAAQQARLTNSVIDFRLAIADTGWADSYRNLIVEITEFLKSDDGKKAAADLASAFSAVADAIIFMLKNLETVKVVMGAIATLFGFKVAASGVKTLVEVGGALKNVGEFAKKAGGPIDDFSSKWPKLAGLVKGAFGVMSAAMLGWQVGTWAQSEFTVVRQAGIALVTGLDEAWTRIKFGAKILWEEIPRFAKNAFATLINTVTWGMRQTLSIMSKGLSAIGQDELAGRVSSVADAMTMRYEQQGEQVGRLKAQMSADIKAIKDIGFQMWQEADKQGAALKKSAAKNAVSGAQTPFPGVKPGANKPAAGDGGASAIKQRENQIEAITRALEALEGKIDRAETDTLSRQLEAVDSQYAALARRISGLGGTTGAEFMRRLNESTAQLKTQITTKFNAELLKEQESLQNKLEDLEAQAGKKSKFSLDSRLAGIRKSYEDTYREIEVFRAKLQSNGMDTSPADMSKSRLDAGIAELQNLERIKFATEERNRLESVTNEIISVQQERIEAIRAQKEVGAISDVEAAARINQINAEAVPAIQAAAQAAINWATAHAAIFASPEQMDLFIQKMQAIAASASVVSTEFTDMQNKIGVKTANGISQGLDQIAGGLENILTGQKSVSDGFRDIAASTVGMFAQFFKDIALAIIKMMIFNALKNSGNPFLAAIGSAGSASVKHAGGIVGHTSTRNRLVMPEVFANAPRYHQGGVPGLSHDEYATILKKNEEVLTADSPRNVLNGGLSGGKAATPSNVRVVLVDDRSNIGDWVRGSEGEQTIVEVMRRNAMTIKHALG